MTPPAITAYINDALVNPAIGQLEKMAVRRHIEDLKHGHERGLVFDPAAGNRAIGFKGFLRHSKGEWAGKPLTREPWQQFVDYVLFGWKKTDGRRRFRIAYLSMARKNGKSTDAAATGHYLFIGDGEPGAEVYTAATKRDQARIVHEEAKRMVLQSADLRELVEIKRDHLYQAESFSKYEPLGADADTLDGLNPHGVIIDELHAHKTRHLFDVLNTATDARRNPLLYVITTAGHDRAGIGFQVDEDAASVLRGERHDDSLFAFIARLDPGDEWSDERNWRKANPNLGISVKIDGLRSKAAKAAKSPSFLNAFLQKHMNVWTQQAQRWLDVAKWDKCFRREEEFPDLDGRMCYVGLDVGTARDLAAMAMVYPLDDDSVAVKCRFFCSETAPDRRASEERAKFQRWIDEGWIEVTPGTYTDLSTIRKAIQEEDQGRQIESLAFDPWNARQLATELSTEDGLTVADTPQTAARLNEPSKLLESLIVSGRIIHDGNPVLRWCVENVSYKEDNSGNIKPIKPDASGAYKIDGVVAMIMGLSEMIREGSVAPEDSDFVVIQAAG